MACGCYEGPIVDVADLLNAADLSVGDGDG